MRIPILFVSLTLCRGEVFENGRVFTLPMFTSSGADCSYILIILKDLHNISGGFKGGEMGGLVFLPLIKHV